MQTRERIHQLVNELPDRELLDVEQFLFERLASGDPLLRALASAREDNESLAPADEEAVEEAHRDIAAGRVVSDVNLWLRLSGAARD